MDSAVADLTSDDNEFRSDAAIWVWARGGDRFSAEEKSRLIAALGPIATGDEESILTAQAIAALVTLGADGAVELALAALRDPRPEVRHIVAAQLVPTGDRRVVEALVALLNDTDGFVREAAATGLQYEGDPDALEPLRAMERDEREDLVAKRSANRAIKALEKAARSG